LTAITAVPIVAVVTDAAGVPGRLTTLTPENVTVHAPEPPVMTAEVYDRTYEFPSEVGPDADRPFSRIQPAAFTTGVPADVAVPTSVELDDAVIVCGEPPRVSC
jgi:hypothetical protein